MPSQDQMIAPISYSIKGAIASTGLSRSRLYEAIAAGLLDVRKDGARTFIMGDSLRAFMQARPKATPTPADDAAA